MCTHTSHVHTHLPCAHTSHAHTHLPCAHLPHYDIPYAGTGPIPGAHLPRAGAAAAGVGAAVVEHHVHDHYGTAELLAAYNSNPALLEPQGSTKAAAA